MCERRIVIGGRGCQVYGDETAKNVIFWFTGEHEKDTIEEVYQQLKETTQVSFWLIACEIEDWNAQLSPWSAPAVYGKEGLQEREQRPWNGWRRNVFRVLKTYIR